MVSALKRAKDGAAVLRVYEAAGKAAPGVRIIFSTGMSQVHGANLIEDTGAAVESRADRLTFDLKPFEMK